MHKCALESDQITSILLRFYNIIIQKEYYLKRWLKVLDVMLKKDKGSVIKKLCVIQLMEADL